MVVCVRVVMSFIDVYCIKSAGLGGMSHLVNFAGTDTLSGLVAARYVDFGQLPWARVHFYFLAHVIVAIGRVPSLAPDTFCPARVAHCGPWLFDVMYAYTMSAYGLFIHAGIHKSQP